jgi:hypothetical protein
MGVGSASVVDYANTYPGTASHVNATGSVGDFEVVVSGSGATTLNLNFQTATSLDPRITFSRTSNATLVGTDGLIQYAPHNLLTYSEQFDDAAWVKTNTTVSANVTTAPDGTLTADKLEPATTAATSIYQSVVIAASSYTGSVYVKKGSGASDANRFYLRDSTTSTTLLQVAIDYDTLVITYIIGSTGASVQNVGNGWLRVSLTITSSLTIGNTLRYGICFVGNNETAGEFAYAWGAQLNEGALQPYYSTTVKNLLGYSQNFENAAWTKSNSSVLYNLLTYSEQFDDAAWVKTNTTVSANVTTAPDGTTTADKLEPATTASTSIYQSVVIAASSYTGSVYVKKGSGASDANRFYLRDSTTSTTLLQVAIDYDTLVITYIIGSTGASVQNVGNGWLRVSLTITSSLTIGNTLRYGICFVGNNETAGEFAYAWGAQLVQSTSPEEYTVTTSASAPIQAIGPFGFDGGEKLVEDTGSVAPYISENSVVNAGVLYTISVYAKESQQTPKRYLDLLFPTTQFGSNKRATFDLSAGTYVTTNSPDSASITPIGNGWYRCQVSATCVTSGTTNTQIRIATTYPDNLTPYTGDGTSGIYIFGAQLSDSASLDPYSYNPVAAPTSTAYYGPRFDYDPATLAPKGLLIEEQRTNLLTYSSEFDNAAWTKANTTVSANVTIAPDGTLTADKLVENTTTAQHLILQYYATTLGQTYTYSIYAKMTSPAEWTVFRLQLGSGGGIGTFDLSAVTASITNANAISASITPVGNGWFRCSLVSTSNGDGSNFIYKNSVIYTGDGTSGIYLWGAQLEAGAFPTSYIPTNSATVTRAADNASMVGSNFSSWYNQSEGTFVTSFDMYYATSTIGAFPRVISVSNGSSANLIDIQSTQYNNENMTIIDTSVQQCSINATQFAANTTGKFAGSFATNNFQISANGVLGIADTVGTVPIVNQMQIGNRWDLIRPMSGHIQSIKYYPTRLPNGTLQGLTA